MHVCTTLQSRPNRVGCRGAGHFLHLHSALGALGLRLDRGATGVFGLVPAALACTFRPLGCGFQSSCPNQTPEQRRTLLRLRMRNSLLPNNRCSSNHHLCRQHRWRWILRKFHSSSSAAVALFAVVLLAVAQVQPRGKWSCCCSGTGLTVTNTAASTAAGHESKPFKHFHKLCKRRPLRRFGVPAAQHELVHFVAAELWFGSTVASLHLADYR